MVDKNEDGVDKVDTDHNPCKLFFKCEFHIEFESKYWFAEIGFFYDGHDDDKAHDFKNWH